MSKRLRDAIIPGIIAAAWVSVYSYKSHGLSTVLTFGLSMVLAYIFYLLSNFRRMPDPERLLPVYLIALAIQMLHLLEEFITRFHVRFPTEIYSSTPFTPDEFILSQTIVFSLLIIGALGIFKGWKIPMIFVWFFVIMMMFVNAVQHPIFAIMVGGYFPGLFTSVFGFILGPILFKRLWEVRGYRDA